jgi:hypothetical protein
MGATKSAPIMIPNFKEAEDPDRNKGSILRNMKAVLLYPMNGTPAKLKNGTG